MVICRRDAASSETASQRDEGSANEQPQQQQQQQQRERPQDTWQEGSTFLGALGIRDPELAAQIQQRMCVVYPSHLTMYAWDVDLATHSITIAKLLHSDSTF